MSDFRLRVFSCVAKNLSLTKASQELFISQPAITKHIQELETMYQTRLFERMGNKISLTDAPEGCYWSTARRYWKNTGDWSMR